jgi:hypothetical protein
MSLPKSRPPWRSNGLPYQQGMMRGTGPHIAIAKAMKVKLDKGGKKSS